MADAGRWGSNDEGASDPLADGKKVFLFIGP
jgi:hypothetical protein